MTQLNPKATKFLETQITFRPATQDDVNFIFNSWLKSFRGGTLATGVSNPIYYAQHHRLIEGICKSAQILVAVNAADLAQIFGYVAYEPMEGMNVVHYIYVKEPYRRLGLGKLLLEQAKIDAKKPFFCTHRTNVMRFLERRYAFVYNPYLAFPAYAAGCASVTDQIRSEWAPDTKKEAKIRAQIMEQVESLKQTGGNDLE